MRIVIDGLPLLGPETGIGKYTFELSTALMRMPEGPEIYYYYGSRLSKRPNRMINDHQVSYNPLKKGVSRWLPDSLKKFLKKEVLRIGLRLKKCDLFHATNYIIPACFVPTISTFHDLSFIRYPEMHPAERLDWLLKGLPLTLRNSSRIIVVSQFTKEELIRLFGVSENRIDVVHLGVTGNFKPRNEVSLIECLKEYGLKPKGYVLAVGTIEPRKNLVALFQAYETLPDSITSSWPLVIVGMKGWKHQTISRNIERLVRKGKLRALGYIPNDRLPFIYAGASLFVYPSLYEGFGLPPLEAMACGVPVIVSNRASLPEVVGDAGLLVEPEDIGELSQAIESLIDDPHRCKQMIHKGWERAKHFTWEACAENTLRVYNDVLR
jgi:glycosyltransferase involved in cell wall biosynthesis